MFATPHLQQQMLGYNFYHQLQLGIEGGFSSHEDFFEDYGAVSEMEISKGLLNLAEALQYVHTVQRKLHLNLTPESVVISSTGDQQRLASPYFLKSAPISHGIRL
eukprot:gene32232-39800_t